MSTDAKNANPTNLFGGKPSGPTEVSGLTSDAGSGARTREVARDARKLGRALGGVDPRKWGNFDMARGIQNATEYEVGRNDRMSPSDAGAMMQRILAMLGVDKETEGVILTVQRAIFYGHAVNSGSVLQPARVFMEIQGTKFQYYEIVKILGVDQRRFFRAWADEVCTELARILDTYDPADFRSREKYAAIQEVAVDRGLQRYPTLIADSAIGCTWLTVVELAALANSKKIVLPTVVNAADSMSARANPVSADQFDSTNHARVQGAAGNGENRA